MKHYLDITDENRFHIFKAFSAVIDTHPHDFIEFAYVMEGAIEHKFNDCAPEIAKKGDYFIVDYNSFHSYKKVGDTKPVIMNFLFFPDFIDRTLVGFRTFEHILNTYSLRFSYKTLKFSPTGKIFHDEDLAVLNIVNNVIEEYSKKNYGYLEYIRCRLIEILVLTIRKIGSVEQRINYSEDITEIINYVKEHYNEKIKISDISQKYNYSVSGLSKKFKNEIGVCFSKYIQRIRIDQSCRLLENTVFSVEEISVSVGYEDIKFFREAFKKQIGISPLSYRKLTKKS